MSDQELRRSLDQARRRLADALPSSPEWAAAIEAVVELEAEVARRHVSSLRDPRTAT